MTNSVLEALHDIALMADACDSMRDVEVLLVASGVQFRTVFKDRVTRDYVVPWLMLERAQFPKDVLRHAFEKATTR